MKQVLSSATNMPDDYVCNGCGAGWGAKLVPDTIYGISIFESCRRHDWAFSVGGNTHAFDLANSEFLTNMLIEIAAGSKWYTPTFLARRRAMSYYEGVVRFGDMSFKWSGTDG